MAPVTAVAVSPSAFPGWLTRLDQSAGDQNVSEPCFPEPGEAAVGGASSGLTPHVLFTRPTRKTGACGSPSAGAAESLMREAAWYRRRVGEGSALFAGAERHSDLISVCVAFFFLPMDCSNFITVHVFSHCPITAKHGGQMVSKKKQKCYGEWMFCDLKLFLGSFTGGEIRHIIRRLQIQRMLCERPPPVPRWYWRSN